jgi:hypothetical protein
LAGLVAHGSGVARDLAALAGGLVG